MITTSLRQHLLADSGVSALCDSIFPKTIPDGSDTDAIVYGVDGDGREMLVEYTTSGLKKIRVGIECYSLDYDQAWAIAAAVEAALTGVSGAFGTSSPQDEVNHIRLERDSFDHFENDTKLYRVSMQFLIAYY